MYEMWKCNRRSVFAPRDIRTWHEDSEDVSVYREWTLKSYNITETCDWPHYQAAFVGGQTELNDPQSNDRQYNAVKYLGISGNSDTYK